MSDERDMMGQSEGQEGGGDITSSSALAVIERASINMQIQTAKQFPRTLSKVKADMLTFATLDEETAAGCFYTLPRGGKVIQGPSVRLAEIAASCFGNLRAGVRVVEVDTQSGAPHATVQAVVHDLEKNVAISIEKRRRIVGKKAKGGRIDEDDINLACNAGSAVALRDAIFKVVPIVLVKPVFDAAKRVAVGQVKSIAAKRVQVVDRLKQMGAPEDRILAAVGCKKMDDVGLAEIEVLIGLGTALKDGETTLEEAFPAAKPEAKPGADGLADRLAGEKKPEAQEKKSEVAPEAKPGADPEDDLPFDDPAPKPDVNPAAPEPEPPHEPEAKPDSEPEPEPEPERKRGPGRPPRSEAKPKPVGPVGVMDAAKRNAVVQLFGKYGISQEDLEATLGEKFDAWRNEQQDFIVQWHAALKAAAPQDKAKMAAEFKRARWGETKAE